MPEIQLSVIIPVSKDRRIKDCIESIKEDVEIVVVLNNNPSEEVINIIGRTGRCKVVFVEGDSCNLAKVNNVGIEAASNEKVFIVGADCLFTPSVIRAIFQELDHFDVVRSNISFLHSNRTQFMVAECRRMFYRVFDGGTKLFTPGLALNRKIKSRIGGYFFDERMGWGEDGEFSRRVKKMNVSFSVIEDEIFHREVGIIHDLRVAFIIGLGTRIEEKRKGISLWSSFKSDFHNLVTNYGHQITLTYENSGLITLAYLFVWKAMYHAGYYVQAFRKKEVW